MTLKEIKEKLSIIRDRSNELYANREKTDDDKAELTILNNDYGKFISLLKDYDFYFVKVENGHSNMPHVYLTEYAWFSSAVWPFETVEDAKKAIVTQIGKDIDIYNETLWSYKIKQHAVGEKL